MTEAVRHRLPNRRGSETFDFICGDFHYVATVSFFPDGRLAEIFIGNGKPGRARTQPPRTAQSWRALHYSTAFRST
jgi:hypothetical protein